MATLAELREQFASSPDCRIVTAEVYLKNLTSHHQLDRADVPAANLLGLQDRVTGSRILVPVEDFRRTEVLTTP